MSHRDEIDDLVREHRGIKASVFGSAARGDDTASSDLDFLVEFEQGSTLFDVIHLRDVLTELLGVPVDVVSLGGLKERDEHIRREAVPI